MVIDDAISGSGLTHRRSRESPLLWQDGADRWPIRMVMLSRGMPAASGQESSGGSTSRLGAGRVMCANGNRRGTLYRRGLTPHNRRAPRGRVQGLVDGRRSVLERGTAERASSKQ